MKRYIVLFLILLSILFSTVAISESSNVLSFLPIGTSINYSIYETSSRLGSYITFNISFNLNWNGSAFVVNGKVIVHQIPAINSNGTIIENAHGSYPYPLSMWSYITSAGTPNGFFGTNMRFTSYNGIPAVEFTNYSNYTYFSLQYLIPLRAYFSVNLNPALNTTFSALINMNSADLSFYTGSYKWYNISFNYVYDGSPVTLCLLVASKSASINLYNYSGKLSVNIHGNQFISVLVPITSFNDLLGIGKFIYNGSTYYLALSETGETAYFNTSVPIIASYIPGTNYYIISVPYSGNLTLVFNNNYTQNYHNTTIIPRWTEKSYDVSNSPSVLYIITVTIIIAVVSYVTFRLRKK